MLRSCSREELDKYIEFAYELAMNLTKSAYPNYCDGIKTKELFIKQIKDGYELDAQEILLFEDEKKVQGFIHFSWDEKDKIVAIRVFNVEDGVEQAISEFIKMANDRFAGYEMYFGVSGENETAVQFLSSQGYECIEDDYDNTAFLDKIQDIPRTDNMIRITKENFQLFQSLHDQIDGMYWNSERLYEDIDNWTILLKEKEEKPYGAIYFVKVKGIDGGYEIFGIDMDQKQHDSVIYKELLWEALRTAKEKGGHFMTFFCEKEDIQDVLQCGFIKVGNYVCFQIPLGLR